ncbi:MAG TPA: hypothetical protein VLH38_04310 [Patescibacteria group bacterium]|nr:hypothetical protein [Patescibacteria group bacterium]
MDEYIIRLRCAYVVLVALAVVLGCIVRSSPGRWTLGNPYADMPIGYDVSWPNCGIKPPNNMSWGIVGITGGISLRPNNCARIEASWFKTLSLYINTGYPGGKRVWQFSSAPKDCSVYDSTCLAYDYGYAEGVYAVHLATSQGLHAGVWWVDVETENSWDDDPLVNRASIQGSIDAIRRETVFGRVGVYSYPAQWDIITGKWHPHFPAWAATGGTKFEDAKKACAAASFTGGPLWLGQYTRGLDRNLPCTTADF